MKTSLMMGLAVLVTALTASAAFDDSAKAVLRKTADQVETRLRAATAIDGKAVTLLPVRGDSEGYFERLLIGARVNAGQTCVISNDEKADERFKRILKEIRWDEVQTTLGTIDPKTVDELGSLKSTQILLEARVSVVRNERRRMSTAEVNLLAYAITTKQYVWSVNLVVDEKGAVVFPSAKSEKVAVKPAMLNVKIVAGKDDAALNDFILPAVRGELVRLGYTVEGSRTPDVVLAFDTTKSVFDKSGNWYLYDGTAHALVYRVPAESGLIAEKTFDAHGPRGLGERQAAKNVAAGLSGALVGWARESLTPTLVGLSAVTFELPLGAAVGSAEDLARPEAIRKTAAGMKGVRSAELVAQDNDKGRFSYRVVYETAAYPGGFFNALCLKCPDLFEALVD